MSRFSDQVLGNQLGLEYPGGKEDRVGEESLERARKRMLKTGFAVRFVSVSAAFS